MVLTPFHGFCMALADSVPGVSGGTVAFILGFYDRFINALHDLLGRDNAVRKTALAYLLKLGVGWIVGMGLCVSLLAGLFADHIYFMSSLFLGLTAASVPFVALAEKDSLRRWATGVLRSAGRGAGGGSDHAAGKRRIADGRHGAASPDRRGVSVPVRSRGYHGHGAAGDLRLLRSADRRGVPAGDPGHPPAPAP